MFESYKLISALDIDWAGIQVEENFIINDTADLINWIKSLSLNSSNGEVGPQGAQGPKGDKGEPGNTGAQGVMGHQGAQGPKGDKGEPGVQGDKGAQGNQGRQGARGAQGPAGNVEEVYGNIITSNLIGLHINIVDELPLNPDENTLYIIQ